MEKTQEKVYENFQIYRADGRNVFVEVLRSAFTIGKVQINFIEYDPRKGNKQIRRIDTYMDIGKFLVLAQDVLSGRIGQLGALENQKNDAKIAKAKKEKKETKYMYAQEIFQDMGGISARRIEQRKQKFNFDVPKGTSVSRILNLTPGAKMPWMLSGQLGLGKENNTGLIVPQGFPKEIVRVPLTNEDLKELVLITKAHIEAYYTSIYLEK